MMVHFSYRIREKAARKIVALPVCVCKLWEFGAVNVVGTVFHPFIHPFSFLNPEDNKCI